MRIIKGDEELNCSTQPVLYHFSSIEEIWQETFKKHQQTGDFFLSVYIVMHGYASMFARNPLKYDEADIMQT